MVLGIHIMMACDKGYQLNILVRCLLSKKEDLLSWIPQNKVALIGYISSWIVFQKSGAFEATLTGKWSFLMHFETCWTMYIWCTLIRIRWLRIHKIWDWTVSTLLVLLPSCRSGLSAGVPPSALWLITAGSGHFSPAYFFSVVLIFSPSRPFLFVVRAILN